MAFELPALPYAHSALADRGMSQETLELHHDKHHQAYVTALNGLVDKNADLQGKSLEEIITLAKDKDLREKGIHRPLRGFLGSAAGSKMTTEARKKYLGEKRSSADDVVELAAHMLDVAGYEIH